MSNRRAVGRPMEILLVEDDARLGPQIREYLRREGYETVLLRDGEQALPVAAAGGFDLLILDLMLPGTHGLDVLKRLRTQSDLPVLVLSARNETTDKVRALGLGADDYVTKPFWPEELLARVQARLRRPLLQRSDTVTLGDLAIDLAARRVSAGGDPIGKLHHLSGQPMKGGRQATICLKCRQDDGLDRVVWEGIYWPGPQSEWPEKDLRIKIGRKIFGVGYMESD